MKPIGISIDSDSLDEAIKKTNCLVEALKEVQQIATNTFSGEEQKRENCLHCGRGLYQGCPNPDCEIGPKRKPFQKNPLE